MKQYLILLSLLISINLFSQTPELSQEINLLPMRLFDFPEETKHTESGYLPIEQSEKSPKDKPNQSIFSDKSISISFHWFLSYQIGTGSSGDYNRFNLKRGYITIKKSLTKNLSGRITPDISVDREGDGEGSIKLRIKFCYLSYIFSGNKIFTKPYIEFGIVHRPWLSFENNVNGYRVQGTMFLERNGINNSADYGITFFSLLGGEMNEEYKKTVNKSYPGKYGSLALGIYNGGGYNALEKNQNKTIEGRFTLRPFPEKISGLQLSYLGAYGKGNTKESPDWNFNGGFLSLEHKYFVITNLYYLGKGNYKGSEAAVDTLGKSYPNYGFSLFGELRIPEIKLSFIGRYDYFKQEYEPKNWCGKRYIFGIAYHLVKGSKILLDYDTSDTSRPGKKIESVFEIAIQVHF